MGLLLITVGLGWAGVGAGMIYAVIVDADYGVSTFLAAMLLCVLPGLVVAGIGRMIDQPAGN